MALIARPLPSDGRMVYRVTAPPGIEPVTLKEAKDFGKVEYDTEDELISGFISSVREAVEKLLGQSLIEQTIRLKMDYWPGEIVKLPRPPLMSVTQVATLDEDDVETVYAATNYYIITEAMPGQLVLRQSVTPPQNTARTRGGFLIDYQAGYGAMASDVPPNIRQAIMLWTDVVRSTRILDPMNPPPEVKNKLELFREMRTMIR